MTTYYPQLAGQQPADRCKPTAGLPVRTPLTAIAYMWLRTQCSK